MPLPDYVLKDIQETVQHALAEDIGSGDITAELIPQSEIATARVITREDAVLCGQAWVDEVFQQIDSSVQITWHVKDGDRVNADQVLFELHGPARSLLTGERTALNFLQLLSGTATTCRQYADLVARTNVKLLDTRKTIPGLRNAQKYAVTQGGCYNHRIGLYDAFLIKENHIAACGGIDKAVKEAREIAPEKPVEVEVENFEELHQAINAGCDVIMLDNFSLADMEKAVTLVNGKVKLEASGNMTKETLESVAKTGVDYISIGGITKNISAIDLSMRISH